MISCAETWAESPGRLGVVKRRFLAQRHGPNSRKGKHAYIYLSIPYVSFVMSLSFPIFARVCTIGRPSVSGESSSYLWTHSSGSDPGRRGGLLPPALLSLYST